MFKGQKNSSYPGAFPGSSFSGELLDLVHGSCGELVTVVAEKANGLWLHGGPIPRADVAEKGCS